MADSTEEPCGCNIRQCGEDYYRVPLENVSRALRTFDNAKYGYQLVQNHI